MDVTKCDFRGRRQQRQTWTIHSTFSISPHSSCLISSSPWRHSSTAEQLMRRTIHKRQKKEKMLPPECVWQAQYYTVPVLRSVLLPVLRSFLTNHSITAGSSIYLFFWMICADFNSVLLLQQIVYENLTLTKTIWTLSTVKSDCSCLVKCASVCSLISRLHINQRFRMKFTV